MRITIPWRNEIRNDRVVLMLTVLTVFDRRLPPRTIAKTPKKNKANQKKKTRKRKIDGVEWIRGLTRLSGEGRLMDLDPTIGGSLSEFGKETHERSEQARHYRGQIEADRGGGGLLEQVLEAVHGLPRGS